MSQKYAMALFIVQKLRNNMLIGIDDTDSLKGGCTTYIGAILHRKLNGNGFPRLIRLNPNIPYKTRGNGAILLDVNEGISKELILSVVEKHSQLSYPNTNPGVAFLKNQKKKSIKILNDFYKKTLSELVTIGDAEKTAERAGVDIHKFKNGRGIIGALAAIGSILTDKTYELIAYRDERNFGKPREIEIKDVEKMNEVTYPKTFDNLDMETNQILITPRGYDPILCGIRGENPKTLNKAWKIVSINEKIQFTQIFETNQGTDCHLRRKNISDINPYDSVIVNGNVITKPKTIEGGHVLFELSDTTGKIMAAAYEPTGNFRNIVRELLPGDKVEVYGGIGKYPTTLNMEKLRIMKLKKIQSINPNCCGKTMTSAGKDKGFKCRICGKRAKRGKIVELSRGISPGLYEVPPRARRHLSKPTIRG